MIPRFIAWLRMQPQRFAHVFFHIPLEPSRYQRCFWCMKSFGFIRGGESRDKR